MSYWTCSQLCRTRIGRSPGRAEGGSAALFIRTRQPGSPQPGQFGRRSGHAKPQASTRFLTWARSRPQFWSSKTTTCDPSWSVFCSKKPATDVQTAASAEEARELLRSFFPDLILMDIQLPGMDGLELTRVLRLDPLQAVTPVIALTAYTDPGDLEKASDAGCNGKISKPIDT